MCNPVMLAVTQFAIQGASTYAQFSAQSAAAEAQNDYYKQNAKAANMAAANRYNDIQFRQNQLDARASNEKQKLEDQSRRARAKATVAAGEAGVQGLSVDALIGDFYGQEGRFENTIQQNLSADKMALRGEADATQATAEGRINSVRRAQGPDFSSAAIRVLGAGLNTYTNYKRNS